MHLIDHLHLRTLGLDASFVGTVDKDAATLKTEHDALFHAANEGKISQTLLSMMINVRRRIAFSH